MELTGTCGFLPPSSITTEDQVICISPGKRFKFSGMYVTFTPFVKLEKEKSPQLNSCESVAFCKMEVRNLNGLILEGCAEAERTL